MAEFISEDDLKTFEGWLKYQGVDATATSPEELASWRSIFDEGREWVTTIAKVGLMKLQPVPGLAVRGRPLGHRGIRAHRKRLDTAP